jgi:hypothetical protein
MLSRLIKLLNRGQKGLIVRQFSTVYSPLHLWFRFPYCQYFCQRTESRRSLGSLQDSWKGITFFRSHRKSEITWLFGVVRGELGVCKVFVAVRFVREGGSCISIKKEIFKSSHWLGEVHWCTQLLLGDTSVWFPQSCHSAQPHWALACQVLYLHEWKVARIRSPPWPWDVDESWALQGHDNQECCQLTCGVIVKQLNVITTEIVM